MGDCVEVSGLLSECLHSVVVSRPDLLRARNLNEKCPFSISDMAYPVWVN